MRPRDPAEAKARRFDYDVVVIGSGFGGSVSALRLTEKGYRVGVLEAGARFDDASLPRTSWQLRRFLFAPRLGCYGIQRVHWLRHLVVLAGAGVGGGSLVYANTLYEPPAEFYADPQWAAIADWRAELGPHLAQAARMLGVTTNPTMTPSDVAMRAVAAEMGVADTFRMTPVGVVFGRPGQPPGTDVGDPFFGGIGPARRTCLECGECMTGCRHGAKNMLTRNYLYLAERAGARVHPLTTATRITPSPGGGYVVRAEPTGSRHRAGSRGRPAALEFHAAQVVLAAGTLGTQRLLQQARADGDLPGLSPRLGELTRTNSESILGAVGGDRRADYSRGVAITSSFFPDPRTHVEPVRYGKGSNAMGLLQTVLVDRAAGGRGAGARVGRWLGELARNPGQVARLTDLRGWSERTVITLVMQSLPSALRLVGVRGRSGRVRLESRRDGAEPIPVSIPVAHEVARRLARRIGGVAGGTIGEVVGIPMTAHIIGGAVIGADPAHGVVDGYHRVFGCPGLHVVDGSAVPANLGVNPSLTITALAERATACWPNAGEADPRPPLGGSYRPVAPVTPRAPVVPAGAPAALRR